MREFHYNLTLYREVGQVSDKVIFEVRREGRVVGHAYGTITKDEPEYHGIYPTREEAEAHAAASVKPESEPAAAEELPPADKKPKPRTRVGKR